MSRRNSSADSGSVQSRLLTTSAPVGPGPKSRNRDTSPRIRSTHSATTSRGLSTRSADLPLGSPISPVAPPTSAIGRCPASWKRRMVSSSTRLPMCRPGAVGIEPAIERDRPGVERLAQLIEVGGLRDQAAPGQLVDDVGHRPIVPPSPAEGETAFGLARGHVRTVDGHRGVAGQPEPPGPVGGAAHPDPGPAADRGSGLADGPPSPAADPGRMRNGDAGSHTSAPSWARSMPSAWHSRAGPRARSRSARSRRGTAARARRAAPGQPALRRQRGPLDHPARPEQDRGRPCPPARRPG